MIHFQSISDDDPVLAHSPMVKGATKILDYVNDHGPIDLTPSKGFKRYFVHWAAKEFAWPGMTEEDLFRVNKVLNEYDFQPLVELHDLLIHLKIGRHYRKAFHVTKAGQGLVGRPGKLFGILTPFYLLEIDHFFGARFGDRLPGNWDIFLNVLNVEAEDGISPDEYAQILYGPKSDDEGIHRPVVSSLYSQVLLPLCWTGLLSEQRSGRGYLSDRVYIKTPLWKAALQLETDSVVSRAVRH
jgi:hypothetical protein